MTNTKPRIGANRIPGSIHGVRILLGIKVNNSQSMVRAKIIEVESKCPLGAFDGKFGFAHPGEDNGAKAECEYVGVAQLQRAIEQLEGRGGVMLIKRDDVSRGCERSGI